MIDLKVEGLKEMDQALKDFALVVQKKCMRDAMRAGANVIRDAAKVRVPVRNAGGTGSVFRELVRVSKGSSKFRAPGFLRANVKTWLARRMILSGATPGITFHVGVHKDAFYGKFLEWGTSKMAARPWMRPAVDAAFPWATEAMIAMLKTRTKQAWKKGQGGLTYVG